MSPPDPKDKRLAARYMAGASLRELARIERCSEYTMRHRIVAAGAIIRGGNVRWVPPTVAVIDDDGLDPHNRAFVAKLREYAAKHHPGVDL